MAAVYAAKILPEERELDWTRSVFELERRIRALAPEPGASTTFRGGPLKILRPRLSEIGYMLNAIPGPGEIRVYGDGAVRVGTGEGSLDLLEVAPAGRKRMDAAAWARGARIEPGERLGS